MNKKFFTALLYAFSAVTVFNMIYGFYNIKNSFFVFLGCLLVTAILMLTVVLRKEKVELFCTAPEYVAKIREQRWQEEILLLIFKGFVVASCLYGVLAMTH